MIPHGGTGRFRIAIFETVVWLALLAGFGLSIAAQLKICSACSETAQYRILGVEFCWFGIGWFSVLMVLQLLKKPCILFSVIVPLALFASAGAEAHFIWIQKYEIGQWCPICLGIATAVFIACVAIVWNVLKNLCVQGITMKSRPLCILIAALAFALGLGGSLLGTQNVSQAAEPDLFLGKRTSQTTVYVVSDWFCPACRKLEPDIDKMIPTLSKSVRLGFVDYPIHKETLNFTPYNLQFLTFEKEKYPALRMALAKVALKTKNPTFAEVQTAVAPLGVKIREINYADTLTGMQGNMAVYRGYNLKSTPSVVVTNTKTRRTKVLVGDKQISEAAIRGAIAEVEKP
ncbi:MAG: thioredoxin domain-containing protein [Desulfuromonadaceae bacterium]